MTLCPTTRARARAALAAAALALGALACSRSDGEEAAATDAPRPVVGVRTAVVGARPFSETVGAIGSVAARPGHVATLGAPVVTRVARVYVAAGQRVAAGQALVVLEQGTLRAAAQGAAAALTAARLAHERALRLAGEGIVPRKEVEQAAAELARARADAVAAERAAQLSVLRSPIPGVVTSLTATLGAPVDAGQPLVEVTDPSALDVLLSVSPADAARVRPGAAVALGAGQSASGEALGGGTVASVSAGIDSVTRAVTVRVLVPATTRSLRVGETVFGRITVATRPAALTVPLEALVPDGDGLKVFVVDAAGVAHARPVTVGGRTDSTAEITRGLGAGERVVTYGAYGVDDSARVEQVEP